MQPSTIKRLLTQARNAGLHIVQYDAHVHVVRGPRAPVIFYDNGDVQRGDITPALARNLTLREIRYLLGFSI